MIDRRSRVARLIAGVAGLVIVVAACGDRNSGGTYTIGISNPLEGNVWREEMICSMKAEAKVSGKVDRLTVINRTTDTAGQIEDLRALIAAGVDAIVLYPSSFDGLDPVIREATAEGIKVVAVDAAVSAESAFVLGTDQEEYGYLGATWLFDELGGTGDVVYMRGIRGVQTDTDRDRGVKRALAEHPGIRIVAETFTDWSEGPATKQIADLFRAERKVDGIWTSGIDAAVVDAYRKADVDFVPIVGADNNAFVGQLDSQKPAGLVGAAVTNPPPVGGAAVALALKLLGGETVQRVTLLTPELWDNTSSAGLTKIQAAFDPELDRFYGVDYTIDGWTGYARADLLACKGPGEE